MGDYVGKICPYCKTKIYEEDEVVICSSCEMPHHKDCWIENQGCTTFGCLGTVQSPAGGAAAGFGTVGYPPQTAVAAFCSACGAPREQGGMFCSVCGTKYEDPVVTQQAVIQGAFGQPAFAGMPQQGYDTFGYQVGGTVVLEPELIGLIGDDKQEYYVAQFKNIKQSNSAVSWNWSAFLFASNWLIHRKMYIWGGIIIAVKLILALIDFPVALFTMVEGVALGLFGNFIYEKYLNGLAEKAKQMPEPSKSYFIHNNGGTNLTVAALVALVAGVVSAIISLG